MTDTAAPSLNRTARMAGALHLALVPLGFFSFVYVPSLLLVRGDATATSANVIASERLFRSGIMAHLASQVVVVFLVLAVYRLMEGVNRPRATLMAVLALVGVPISFLAELNQLAVLTVLGRGAVSLAEPQAQGMLFLELHRSAVLLAQFFWGLWLLVLASLVFASGFLPRLLGIAVLVGAAGYLIDSGAHVLVAGAGTISQYTFVGELALPVWLLTRGVAVGSGPRARVA